MATATRQTTPPAPPPVTPPARRRLVTPRRTICVIVLIALAVVAAAWVRRGVSADPEPPGPDVAADVGARPGPTETGAPGPDAVDVRSFGARGDGETDDTAAIQAALDSLTEGGDLVFPAGTYRYSDWLVVRHPGVHLWGGSEATLEASVEDRLAVMIEGARSGIHGFRLTAPNVTGRGDGLESHRIVLNQVLGSEVRDNVVDGGPASGIFAFGAGDYEITGNTVQNTMADGIHNTYGSARGLVADNLVRHPGDDCIAVVSYVEDEAIVTGVLVEHNTCQDSYNARGLSVVGGNDIVLRANLVASTKAAGIYLASEDSYNTYAAHGVQVVGNQVSQANTDASIDHAAIFGVARDGTAVADGQEVSLENEDIVVSENYITDPVPGRKAVRFILDDHRRVTVDNTTVEGDVPAEAIQMEKMPVDAYELRDNLVNGQELPDVVPQQ